MGVLPSGSVPILGKGSNFKFILYASFQSREEAIGLELIEGLRDVTEKAGLKNFELVVRISNENKFRWDKEFIEK